MTLSERIETDRVVAAPASEIFSLLCDPQGHVAIDGHDCDLEQDREISWTTLGRVRPPIGHFFGYRLEPVDDGMTRVTSFYDWSDIEQSWRELDIFPVISEQSLRGTLGILDRTVRRGYARV